jgi:hypothetical protein
MTFRDSLYIVATDYIFKLVIPDKAMGLTAKMKRTREAFEDLRVCLNSYSLIFVHLCLPFESFIWRR